jgi:hypothetical protein
VQGGEETSHFWTHVGDEWLDIDVAWCHHLWLGSCLTLGCFEGIKNDLVVPVKEDETTVQFDVWYQELQLLIDCLVVDETLDDGFLSEKNLDLAAKKTAESCDLDCFDVADVNDDDLLVILE